METIQRLLIHLDDVLPDAKCELHYNTPYQLLIAVILSAQCTDKRVNEVTNRLFSVAPDAESMLSLGQYGLADIIHSIGFFNAKSKNIINCSQDIMDKYNGIVPDNMAELTSLAGVGRKTANVVLAEIYHYPSIAVDTHVHRVSRRLNICGNDDTAEQCEQKILKIVDTDRLIKLHHQLVLFGRYYCTSQRPKCDECPLSDICAQTAISTHNSIHNRNKRK